ncbi:Hypothetical protein NTJ_14694 [Nesidiocoris tenuis]|uniref:Uncharacterized protein n=1 Tax=Nesidiocoris tenuis TaxID=355587 RepID=A0ABN7BBX2_9HEMI|nr:Hypothetical protein NTJ_14694 [Nesidiocoris tenuis]
MTTRPAPYSYDAPLPEKEPLQFDVQLKGAPEEIVNLVHNIKQVGEQFLYHWKTFPIVLPSPVNAVDSAPLSTSADIPYITGGDRGGGNGDRNLPPTLGVSGAEGCSTLGRRCGSRPSSLRDLFVTPTSFDELDAVAMDTTGEPRRLTAKQLEALRERGLHKDYLGKQKRLMADQLESIRRTGEFEVPSLNFPGQVHRWKLSSLLQRGTANTHDTLLNDLALALRFIIVTAKARLISHFFSVTQALAALIVGLIKLLDIMLGVSSVQAQNLDGRLREERSRYLVAELVCRTDYEDSLEVLCLFVRRQLRRAATEKFEIEREASHPPVPIPYLFYTPKGTEVDLRLFSRDIMRKALPILMSILERETRGWFLHFRERLISELRQQKRPDDEIEREVNEAVMREYLERVYAGIHSNTELRDLGDGIPQLLVEQAQAVVLMHRAVENVQQKLSKSKESLQDRLEKNYPVRSRIGPWLRDRLRDAEESFIEECKWSAHEEALTLCNNQHLSQTVYFLHRDLTFMKEREPVLKKELKNDKSPTRVFHWRTHIWFPSNWIVRRSFQGHSEIIPTVLSSTATSITTPRSDPSQPVFLVEKEIIRTTTTRWPFWRWINYCHRTWSWTWNAMFFFGVVIPWCSPVSVRALFCISPFTPDLELSQVNGTLFPRQSSSTATMIYTLRTLARHISKATTQFESKPDTGFIGKEMTRQLNKTWNYIGKGVFGTLGIVLIFPVVCLLSTIICLAIAATAFIWMPVVTLLLQIGMGLFYDLDSPVAERNKYLVVLEALVWDIGVRGFLQPIAAIFVSCVVCPISSLIVTTAALLRFVFRLAWDALTFHLIIKKRGRIPACESVIVKRIEGPGLNNNYYYQIRPEQALAAFEAKLELDELAAFQHQMEIKIMQPQKDYSQFVSACFGPFSATLARVGAYKSLEREGHDLMSSLLEKLERRRRDLHTGLSTSLRSKLKLNTIDLKIVIQQGALMLERYYPSHVLWRLGITEQEFWDGKALQVNDWPGLAALLYADIFSLDFLTPLDECDTSFRLEASPQVDLTRYSELVRGAGGLDLLGPVYAPRANIQVHSPFLDVSAFNPRHRPVQLNRNRDTNTGQSTIQTTLGGGGTVGGARSTRAPRWWPSVRPWKRPEHPYSAEKLVIPLPVPHPAQIALTIYNRDTDNPIPVDSDTCKHVLRGLEEGGDDGTGAVARYRGGGADVSGSVDSLSSSGGGGSSHRSIGEPWADWTTGPSATGRSKRTSTAVRVDLASPEDITLDSDSTRVVFSAYGTTV